MKKSIFSQTFIYLFFSILLVVILLSSIFFFSIRRSVSAWNVNRGQRLENLILPVLTQVYRERGELEEVTIHNALSPFLTSNVFAYVFDEQNEPLYIYSNGGRIPLYNENKIEESLARLDDQDRPPTPIISNGEIIGYLAADTLGFTHDVANRKFLQNVFSFAGWGILFAVIVAVAASFIFSKIFSRQARSLVTGLQQLTEGERAVEFPSPQSEEMHAIAETANYLQFKLQKEEKIRRQWAEDVAHDLRTPISALKVQLEGITDGVFKPTHTRLLSLKKEVERIESLVQDLRELNKMESPEMKLNREIIAMEPLLHHAFSQFTSPGDSGRPTFSIECQIDNCSVDRHYLHRALTNVLQNAVQHSGQEGTIYVKVARQDKHVYFDISNPGIIEQEEAHRFFDRLYRNSKSRTNPGSGLGLPITRAIMRLHGGDAWIRQVGERTHVILTLEDTQECPHEAVHHQNDNQSRE